MMEIFIERGSKILDYVFYGKMWEKYWISKLLYELNILYLKIIYELNVCGIK